MLQWIHGKTASAVRLRNSGSWLVISSNERPLQDQTPTDQRSSRNLFHFGLLMQLRRLREEQKKDSQNAFSASRKRTYANLVFAGFGMFLILVLGSSLFQTSLFFPIRTIQSSASSLLQLPLTFWLTIQGLVLFEWFVLQTAFSNRLSLLEWNVATLRVHRVAWELTPLVPHAITVIVGVITTMILSGYLAFTGLSYACGVFLASWLFLILVISPFSSTPACHLYNRLLGTERILQVQDQFLLGLWIDPSQALKGKTSWVSYAATFSLIAWIILVAFSFGWIADSLSFKTSLDMLVIQLICNIMGLTFGVWMILRMLQFLRQNSVLRRAHGSLPFQPTSTELNHWQSHCALIRHIPQLATLPWEWHWYKAGTMLIRKGETHRDFYWMASGEASVLGIDSRMNNVQYATLHGGSGFGEVVFFHGGQRNADVYLRTDAIIASLNFDALSYGFSNEQKENMELLILASQAMDVSPLFHAMPSFAKEEWLASATFHSAQPGDVLIQAGSEETWMGLVIHGGPIKVEREGKNVANLKKGAVFGEMAHWTSSARSATIIATQHTNYLRWEPWFWAEQVKRHGLETHLEKLIQKRNS